MSQPLQLHLVHLYPQEMNIYGDTGNRLILQRRCQWRGVELKLSLVGISDRLPNDADIILGGGAQDAVQRAVEQDLSAKTETLHKFTQDGVVMLMVCGMYQLFGRSFTTSQGQKIKGAGIFNLETTAGTKRFIGNTIYDSPWGQLVGYENHSGLTFLDDLSQALGKVRRGAGNNGQDGTEGCLHKNIFGTYSHGPILSKNPSLADELISRALIKRYGAANLNALDDDLELRAATVAKTRPR